MARYIEASLVEEKAMVEANAAKSGFERTLMTALAAFIGALPTADVAPVRHGEWISVKDRLPGEGKEVLIASTDEQHHYYCDTGYYTGEHGYEWAYSQNYLQVEDVTHWMPLPEPPKEGAYNA